MTVALLVVVARIAMVATVATVADLLVTRRAERLEIKRELTVKWGG